MNKMKTNTWRRKQ